MEGGYARPTLAARRTLQGASQRLEAGGGRSCAEPVPAVAFHQPRLLVHTVRTPRVQEHKGAVTLGVNDLVGGLHHAATSGVDVPAVGHVDGGDLFGAHEPSARITSPPGKGPAPASPVAPRRPAPRSFAWCRG